MRTFANLLERHLNYECLYALIGIHNSSPHLLFSFYFSSRTIFYDTKSNNSYQFHSIKPSITMAAYLNWDSLVEFDLWEHLVQLNSVQEVILFIVIRGKDKVEYHVLQYDLLLCNFLRGGLGFIHLHAGWFFVLGIFFLERGTKGYGVWRSLQYCYMMGWGGWEYHQFLHKLLAIKLQYDMICLYYPV